MDKNYLRICDIPAIIWGNRRDSVYVFVHGRMSSKEEAEGFAEKAARKSKCCCPDKLRLYIAVLRMYTEIKEKLKEALNLMKCIKGFTDITPKEAGYDESRIEVLNAHFQKLIDAGEIQCAAYCASRGGKVFMHGALGKKSFRQDDTSPAEPSSIQYAASVTKLFTSVAVMKLVEDGLTRLDVPVWEILPQFNKSPFNAINLFHLLTHTSGMHPDSGCFENGPIGAYQLIHAGFKLHKKKKGEFDWIAAALTNGVRMETGKEWAYCSFGFTLLGEIIKKLTGIPAEKYIEDNILKPLKMTDSGFDCTPEHAKRSIIQNKSREEYLNGIINGTLKPDEEDELWKTIPSTGGGMYSTAYDLARFGNMTLNGGKGPDGARIIGRKALEKMTRRAIFDTPDYTWQAKTPDRGYGVGFDMRFGPAFTFSEGTYNHEGAGACALYIDPAEKLTAAWIVPFAKEGWFSRALFSVQNIIWSGLE